MKHRADTIERPTSRRGGAGRHAQPKNGAVAGDAELNVPAQVRADVGEVTEVPVPDARGGFPAGAPLSEDATDVPVEHRPPVAADLGHAPDLAETAKWRTRSLTRSASFLLLLGAAAVAGLTGRLFAEARTDDRMNMFVAAALVVAGLWALLTATAPQIVTLRGSLLTIKSRRGTEQFDLADGMQQVDVIGDPRSSKWAVVLHRSDCSTVQISRRDVDALVLDPVVRHFRGVAERRRSEHWARFGL